MPRSTGPKIRLKTSAEVRSSTYNPREFRGQGWAGNISSRGEANWGWWVLAFVALDLVVVATLIGLWDFPAEGPLPSTGTMKQLIPLNPTMTAPLRLNAGNGPYNYYVIVSDAATGKVVQEVFVRRAETANVRVAPGRYRLEYVYGEKWEGNAWLFGSRTRRVKFPDPIQFKHEGGRGLGMSIDLEPL